MMKAGQRWNWDAVRYVIPTTPSSKKEAHLHVKNAGGHNVNCLVLLMEHL